MWLICRALPERKKRKNSVCLRLPNRNGNLAGKTRKNRNHPCLIPQSFIDECKRVHKGGTLYEKYGSISSGNKIRFAVCGRQDDPDEVRPHMIQSIKGEKAGASSFPALFTCIFSTTHSILI